MEKVYVVCCSWNYSEEDHDSNVVAVFSKEEFANVFVDSMNSSLSSDSVYSFYLESHYLF